MKPSPQPCLFPGMRAFSGPLWLLFLPVLWPTLSAERGPATEPVDLTAYSHVYYVNLRGGLSKNETGDREYPFKSLAAALAQAGADAGPGHRIALLVASGYYLETPYTLRPHVDLFGGFDPATWQRDIFRFPTYLDGRRETRVVMAADHARLDGFIIQNGRLAAPGPGILCQGVSPRISNNIIRYHRVLAPPGWAPRERHEIAFDGAAIAAREGAAPRIENNLIAFNETVIGRGAAIALHLASPAVITGNIILQNTAGLDDPMRSSDAGGVSIYGRSHATLENNLIAMNRAEGANDAGGVFVTLWCNSVIRGNDILGNYGSDDAGGLFIGGQEHRYSIPYDPVPPASTYQERVEGNRFFGNHQPSGNSGAFRITMEARVFFANNLLAANPGGAYFQRCEVRVHHNTFVDGGQFIEAKETVQPGVFTNNIFAAPRFLFEAPAARSRNLHPASAQPPPGNLTGLPGFRQDGLTLTAVHVGYDELRAQTTLRPTALPLDPGALAGRVVSLGGSWTTVAANTGDTLTLWGHLPAPLPADALLRLEFPPTYELAPGSLALDAGEAVPGLPLDALGRPRSIGAGPDLGAFEHLP